MAWLEAQAKDLAQAQKFFRDDYIRECKELDKKTAEFEEKSKQLKKEREQFEKESAGRKDDEDDKDEDDEEPPAAESDKEMIDEDEEHPAAESDKEMVDKDDDEKMDDAKDDDGVEDGSSGGEEEMPTEEKSKEVANSSDAIEMETEAAVRGDDTKAPDEIAVRDTGTSEGRSDTSRGKLIFDLDYVLKSLRDQPELLKFLVFSYEQFRYEHKGLHGNHCRVSFVLVWFEINAVIYISIIQVLHFVNRLRYFHGSSLKNTTIKSASSGMDRLWITQTCTAQMLLKRSSSYST